MSPTWLIQAQIDIFSLQAHDDNNKNMISSYSPSDPLHPPFLSLSFWIKEQTTSFMAHNKQ